MGKPAYAIAKLCFQSHAVRNQTVRACYLSTSEHRERVLDAARKAVGVKGPDAAEASEVDE